MKIDEKVFGPEHPNVGSDVNNIGQILKGKSDLDGALFYIERALRILEKCYGVDHPDTKTVTKNRDAIKKAMAVKAPAMPVVP